MPVNIHGKEYKTVAERLDEIGTKLLSVNTEVLYLEPQIMVKATITTDRGVFTGISAADPSKSIEAKTPVEVAETSAVGRALAFAGYAGSEIASANEMEKAGVTAQTKPVTTTKTPDNWCEVHKTGMRLNKNGNPFHMDKTRPEGDQFCNGRGFKGDARPTTKRVESTQAEDIADQIPF